MNIMKDSSSIRSNFINGVFWGVIEKFCTLFVGFFITILLARKLLPSDYGLVNMLYIFTVFANVILDAGFGQALIQKKYITESDTNTVFYFNIIFSLILYLLLFLLSPYIADFYRQPQLIDIARVSFLMIPINSICIIQHTLLTKAMKVRELTIVSFFSSLVAGVVGVMLAYKDYGVWALVFQSLVLQFVRSIILWYFSSWRPKLIFDIKCIQEFWGFSINMLGVGMLAALFQNIYTVVIGRFYNVTDVGFYNQAQRLESIASTSITGAIQRVTFPVFAEIQGDKSRLKEAFKKIINLTMYIHLPIMFGLISISEELFLFLFGQKWIDSVPYFCLLCLASSLYPLHMINVNVLKGLGYGKLFFRLETLKRFLMLLFIILTINYSIFWLLVGYTISMLISVFVNMYYCGKSINYSFYSQLKDLFPVFVCTFIMFVGIKFANSFFLSSVYRLILDIFLAIILYLGSSYVFKVNSLFQLLNILKR